PQAAEQQCAKLWSGKVRGVELHIAALPVVSHVGIRAMVGGTFEAPLGVQLATYLAPWLVLLLGVAPILGVHDLLAQMVATVPHLVVPMSAGLDAASALFARFFARFDATPLRTSALLWLHLIVFNLLPLPHLSGGRALIAGLRLSDKTVSLLATLSMWATMPLLLGWLWVIGRYPLS
ncbi:MAG TPA: hypothetical protein VHM19_17720, partial [Polyangiales bacterium]|nr:hypothetical protein [Polyangiales bacterium]